MLTSMTAHPQSFPFPQIVVVDTIPFLFAMLWDLQTTADNNLGPGGHPLYLDFEGIDLSRNGKICLGQIYYPGAKAVYLVDFCALPPGFHLLEAPPLPGSGRFPMSYKRLLEWDRIAKVIFDPRNDIDALWNHLGILPRNVLCLQLVEAVYRSSVQNLPVRFVSGLRKVMETHLGHVQGLQAIKHMGLSLFAPEKGGAYEVWTHRPLDPRLAAYAASDVIHFEEILRALYDPLSEDARRWVLEETARRTSVAFDPLYNPHGREKAIAPMMPYFGTTMNGVTGGEVVVFQ